MLETTSSVTAAAAPLLGGRRLAGVVFDLDGTLVDNMPLHAQAFDVFAGRHGLPPLTLQDHARYAGQRNRDILPDLLGRALGADELRALIDEKEGLYRELSRGKLVPLPGLRVLLDALLASSVPVAVATAAPAENVPHTLDEIGLRERFAVVVRADEVGRGKPAPDVFLEAARRLGRDPRACLAFEDAPLGVQAARAAGMACVALATTFSAAELERHGGRADRVVRDYAEFLAQPTPAARQAP